MAHFSIVIPTYNSARQIGWTLKSLEIQTHSDLEVIIVDAKSSDATLELVQRCSLNNVRIYAVAEYNLFDMINRGISLATGDYLSVLTPGSVYIARDTIEHMANLCGGHPDLLYCGTLLRELTKEPQTLLHAFSKQNLREGRAPTSYQACWYRIETLRKLGKLDSTYRIQGGLDLFNRLAKRDDLKVSFTERILVDRDRREVPPATLLRRFWETVRIIRTHHGWRPALIWAIRQNPWAVVRWWWRSKRPHLFS